MSSGVVQASGYCSYHVACIGDMSAGDTAEVDIYISGSTKEVDIHGGSTTFHTYFQGYLLQ